MFRRRAGQRTGDTKPESSSTPQAEGGRGHPAGRRGAPTEPASAAGSGQREPFTYIQRGTQIVGRLEATGRVRVHGVVRGDVTVAGPLEVAESGLVEGTNVEADEVKIIGRLVVEQLVVKGKVEIWAGGELIGDVVAAALDIEEGARFTGRSEMAEPPSGAQRATADTGIAEAELTGSKNALPRLEGRSAGTADALLEAPAVGEAVERG